MTSGSAVQHEAEVAVRWGSLSYQQAEDCGRGIARSFLRPPFMCAYGGSSSRDGRIVTPAPVPAARLGPDSPLAACWLEACLSMAAADVQGEDGELELRGGAWGASEPGEGGVCCKTVDCCDWVEEAGSRGMSSTSSILSRWACESSLVLWSAL